MNAGSGRRSTLMVATALMILLAPACRPPGTQSEPNDDESKRLEPGILRAVDLLAVPEVGPLRRLTDAEVPNYQGPDFRGACGQAMAQPEASKRLAAAFVGQLSTFSEVIVELDTEGANELIGNVRDAPEDCDPQVSRTSQGQTQTYVQGAMVDIGRVGDDRVASRATLEVDGTRVNLVSLLIRSGKLVLYGLISSEEQLDPEAVERLAQVMVGPFEELAV